MLDELFILTQPVSWLSPKSNSTVVNVHWTLQLKFCVCTCAHACALLVPLPCKTCANIWPWFHIIREMALTLWWPFLNVPKRPQTTHIIASQKQSHIMFLRLLLYRVRCQCNNRCTIDRAYNIHKISPPRLQARTWHISPISDRLA